MRAENECIYLAKYRSKTLDYEKQNDSDIQMDIDRYGSDKYRSEEDLGWDILLR